MEEFNIKALEDLESSLKKYILINERDDEAPSIGLSIVIEFMHQLKNFKNAIEAGLV